MGPYDQAWIKDGSFVDRLLPVRYVEQFMRHLGAAGGAFFIDFLEFSDFSKNRIFDPFFDSGGPGTVLDRSGMQKYPRGLIFSSGARF